MDAVVGRDRELEAIEDFLDGGASDERVLLLAGEAGIGKTTLWRAAVRVARGHGFCVASSSASPAETQLAFAAIGDLLGPHVDDVLPVLPTPQARALEVALRRAEAAGPAPDPATIAVAILSSLRALAETGPTIVAVDDVQWLDAPSAAALAFALRRLGDEELRFVLAQRAHAEARLPLGLDRYPEEQFTRVEIGPLSLGAISAVVTGRLGTALPRPTLRRLHETSNGNPFFALELARALVRVGGRVEPGEALPVPTSLDELLAARLVALPGATRVALLPVAALRDPTTALVAEALGVADPRAKLQPAVDAHVVEVEEDRVRFTHPLLAAAVYARADRETRRDTHRALARMAKTVEERARHRALASEPPDVGVARELDEAARAAVARGAPAIAAELGELAARFTSSEHGDEQRRRLCDAADFHLLGGDARRAYAVAAPLVENAPPGIQRARALFVLGFTDPETPKRLTWAEQALTEAAGTNELAARINLWLFMIYSVQGTLAEARACGERGLALGGTALTRAQATGLIVFADLLAGKPPDDELLEAGLEMESEASEASMLYRPSMIRAIQYTYTDQANEASAAFDAVAHRAAEYGEEYTLAALHLHRTELECRAGRFAVAAATARAGYAMAQQLGMQTEMAVMAWLQALAHGFLGDVEITRAKAAEAASRLPGLFEIRAKATLGLLELSLGDVKAAATELRPLPDRLFGMGYGEAFHLESVPAAIEALAELGELNEAERMLDLYERKVAQGHFGRAATARSRGIVAAARGELDRAFDAFTEALREHDAIDTPFERARTLLALGRVQRRARQRREARASLDVARAVFEELGARLWAERAAEELGRIGGRRATRGDLTPSERRIAELVAEGKTNKEAAAILVVADRTVESALTQIYRKLGVRSRTELAKRLDSTA